MTTTAEPVTEEQRVGRIFASDVDKHEMAVLLDAGLYRHVRFRSHDHGFSWFDLVTWPGALCFSGDHGTLTFRRIEDMFQFFRGDRINPHYWAEKEQSEAPLKEFSEDLYRQVVVEHFVDVVKARQAPAGLGLAVREQLLDTDDMWYPAHEETAHEALRDFEFKGFRFADTWEWNLTDWSGRFLWICHAIRWGIEQYDAHKATQPADTAVAA